MRPRFLPIVILFLLMASVTLSHARSSDFEQKRANLVEMMVQFAVRFHCIDNCSQLDFSQNAQSIAFRVDNSEAGDDFSRSIIDAVRRQYEAFGFEVVGSPSLEDGQSVLRVTFERSHNAQSLDEGECEIPTWPSMLRAGFNESKVLAREYAVGAALSCGMKVIGFPEYRAAFWGVNDGLSQIYLRAIEKTGHSKVSFDAFKSALIGELQ